MQRGKLRRPSTLGLEKKLAGFVEECSPLKAKFGKRSTIEVLLKNQGS